MGAGLGRGHHPIGAGCQGRPLSCSKTAAAKGAARGCDFSGPGLHDRMRPGRSQDDRCELALQETRAIQNSMAFHGSFISIAVSCLSLPTGSASCIADARFAQPPASLSQNTGFSVCSMGASCGSPPSPGWSGEQFGEAGCVRRMMRPRPDMSGERWASIGIVCPIFTSAIVVLLVGIKKKVLASTLFV